MKKKLELLKLRPKYIDNSGLIRPDIVDEINKRWSAMICTNTEDRGTLIGLPNPYVVPSINTGNGFSFEEQYYWDSYFTALGLTDPEYQELVEGMLDNLIYLFNRFSLIPNASRMYMTSRSQPPILTSYIFHVYDTYNKDLEWLRSRIKTARKEYETVWSSDQHPLWHNVFRGLSRYYDINVLHDLAEAESGWDMTTRFDRKCLDYLPVDLNALLYKYETDFARFAQLDKNVEEAEIWINKSEARKNTMNELMWAKFRGTYFDYNYQKQEQGNVWSLAAYYPMWVGMASEQQAAKLAENITKFEKSGGLTTTTRSLLDSTIIFGSLKAQWAYPNGWAPLHLIVIEGLRRYGYNEIADRISNKWIKTNIDWFDTYGVFIEKYNVVNPKKPPLEGVYPSQFGFGWTNAVLIRLMSSLQNKS
jgi:alpha,alpha-trehalase